MTEDVKLAARLQRAMEPDQSMLYLVPERAAEYEAIGLGSGPMGYLASRSAPMGPVNTAVVARSIPRAWMLAGTAEILAAR
jgi:hypothetical protein